MSLAWGITYNSYTIGGSSTVAFPVGGVEVRETFPSLLVRVEFVLVGASAADYQTKEAAMRTALRTPEATFAIGPSGEELYSGSASAGTAKNIRTTLTRVPSEEHDSAFSGLYRFELTADLQADLDSRDGRLEASFNVDYSAARQRTVTFRGTYTYGDDGGGSATTARAEYEANFATWASGILTGLGGTYELVGEPRTNENDDRSRLDFEVVYREIAYTTSTSNVVFEAISYTKPRGYDSTPTRQFTDVAYTGFANIASISEDDLDATWETVLATLKAKALTALGGTTAYVVDSQPDLDFSTGELSGVARLLIVGGSWNYVRAATISRNTDGTQVNRLRIVAEVAPDPGTTTARSNYVSTARTALIAAATGDYSGTYNLADETIEYDDVEEEGLRATIDLIEEIDGTGVSGAELESIVVTRVAGRLAEDAGTVRTVQVQYSGQYDVDTVSGDTLATTTWPAVITALKSKAVAMYGGSAAFVRSQQAGVDRTTNVLSGTVVLDVVGGSYAYRAAARIQVQYDASRRRTVTFTGTYATSSDSTGDAPDQYASDAKTWAGGILTADYSGVTFELIAETPAYDQDKEEAAFQLVYLEQLYTADSSGAAKGERLTIRRVATYAHGKSANTQAQVGAVVDYACAIDQDVTTQANAMTLYTGTIRSALLAKIAAYMGGTVVVRSEEAGPDPTGNFLTARLVVLLRGVGADLMRYDLTTSYAIDENLTLRRRWDGEAQSYNLTTPGSDITASVTLVTEKIGAGAIAPEFEAPLSPPAGLGASNKAGRWVRISGQVTGTHDWIGKNPDGGATVEIRSQTTTAVYAWVSTKSKPNPGLVTYAAGQIPRLSSSRESI